MVFRRDIQNCVRDSKIGIRDCRFCQNGIFIDQFEKGTLFYLIENMNMLKKQLMFDPVKAVFVDFTKLNLVELTRKKVKVPFGYKLRMLKKDLS